MNTLLSKLKIKKILLKDFDNLEIYLLGSILAFYILSMYLPSAFLILSRILFLSYLLIFLLNSLIKQKIELSILSYLIVIWISFKVFSIYKSGWNDIVSLHLVSVLGFSGLFFLTSSRCFKSKQFFILANIVLAPIVLFSLLTLFFNKPFLGLYDSRRVLTIFGIQNDPNNLATYYCFGFLISLYLLVENSKKNKLFLLYLIPLATCAYSCFLTGSRAGLICLIVSLVLGFSFFGTNKIMIRIIRFGGICIAIIFVTLLILMIKPDLLSVFFVRFVQAFNDGGSGRIDIWKTDLELLYSNPLFGGGWGSATYYGKIFEKAVHNTFLSSLAENGFVGSLPLFLIFAITITKATKEKRYFQLFLILIMMISAFFLDSINKPFFWIALILSSFRMNDFVSKPSLKEIYYYQLEI